MLEERTIRDIFMTRFGTASALSLIGLYFTFVRQFNLIKINVADFHYNLTSNTIGWVFFVWMLAVVFSGNMTISNGKSLFPERVMKTFELSPEYSYWSVAYGLIAAAACGAVTVFVKLRVLSFEKIGANVVILSLAYLALYIFMNYHEFAFVTTRKLVTRFFFSRLFLGFVLATVGLHFFSEIFSSGIINAFSNIVSIKFLIAVSVSLLGIVSMFIRREASTLIAAGVLLLVCALVVLQLPAGIVYLADKEMVKIYYSDVMLTWQFGAAFGLTLAAGLTLFNYYWREVKR